MKLTPEQIDESLRVLREQLVSAESVDLEFIAGYRESGDPFARCIEYARTGARRIVITIDGHKGGFEGDHLLTDEERLAAMLNSLGEENR